MTNILLLNWNSSETAKECINSIVRSENKNFRIILINNFSTITDLNEIRKIHDLFKEIIEIYLVENKINHGYAGGNNEGIKFLIKNNLAGNILILNPDVQISDNTISEMEKAMKDGIGIISVRTVDKQGEILFDSIKLKGFLQKYKITDQKIIETDYSQGSCMLINRESINQVGFFDERFFLYWEEVDFSLRIKKLGQKLISITTTQVIREKNDDTRQPLAFYYSIRNAKLIMKKHKDDFSIFSYLLYLSRMFLLTFKFLGKFTIFKSVIANYFLGILDSFNNKYYRKNC